MSRPVVPLDQRNIIAIGGALGSNPQAGPTLLKYMLSLTGKPNPNLMFVNTAQGDSTTSTLWFYQAVVGLQCHVTFVPFFQRTPRNLTELTLNQDCIFVGGGNTKSALAVWREYGFDKDLHKAWERGIVLGGSSAGGICWFEQCVTDSFADIPTALNCMGILNGSCCPHYDGEKDRRPAYHEFLRTGTLRDGYAIDECAGIHFVGNDPKEAVSAKPGATAYRVYKRDGNVVEEPLKTVHLA